MNIFTKITTTFIVLLLACKATPVLAAEIRLEASRSEINRGDQFSLEIMIHGNETVNAVEGQVVFPKDLLAMQEIHDGNSIINFWVEKPRLKESGKILFSGITPKGFSGANNRIFSIVFEAKNTGTASIILEKTKVLLNDGAGTQTELSTYNTSVAIKPGDNNIRKATMIDKDLPEDFTPTINNDPNIFDGKYFLVFSTQDKLSGIAHYEVREGDWGWFTIARSPYLLKNQALDNKIFVKAIDEAGNERIEILNPKNHAPWYQAYTIPVMLFLLVLVVFFIKKLWPKFAK